MFGKHIVTICAVTAAVAATACNDPKRDQAKADQAQRDAVQKTDQAQREAKEQSARARANAQQEQQSANDSLEKARAEYRDKTRSELGDVDAKIADLEARQSKATGKARTDVVAALDDLRQKRELLRIDLQRIDTTTAAAWDQLKSKVDADVEAVKKARKAAPEKI
jgi:hypothetical protein